MIRSMQVRGHRKDQQNQHTIGFEQVNVCKNYSWNRIPTTDHGPYRLVTHYIYVREKKDEREPLDG
jgi:hypothetical protein